jgi:YVTN family beta-propeller protein
VHAKFPRAKQVKCAPRSVSQRYVKGPRGLPSFRSAGISLGLGFALVTAGACIGAVLRNVPQAPVAQSAARTELDVAPAELVRRDARDPSEIRTASLEQSSTPPPAQPSAAPTSAPPGVPAPSGAPAPTASASAVPASPAPPSTGPTPASPASPAVLPSPGPSAAASAPAATTAPATAPPRPRPTIRPAPAHPLSERTRLSLLKVISGGLDPKSVVASGTGLYFAQNMMYLHTINVYDSSFRLLKVIPDTVELAAFGFPQYPGFYKGAPVEAAMTPDHKYAYVSNYSMYGPRPFNREGSDECNAGNDYPDSFVYRIALGSLKIDQAIEVGAVPKYVAVTPDGKYLLVSNWCSYNESIVDVRTHKQIRQIALGPYPRGIAVSPDSTVAYIAVMGSTSIAVLDLRSFAVSWIRGVGDSPRHLVISPDGRSLYATINGDGVVDKIDIPSRSVTYRVATGKAPRSMAIASDGGALYVVNYESNTVAKLRTSDMQILQSVRTNEAPIGITYDPLTHRVWVACYSGSLMVFNDATIP